MLKHISLDFRTSLRGLLRSPMHALAAILTLGVALGGFAAVFALVEAVMLRGLPYADSNRLVAVWADYSMRADELGLQDPRREWTNFDDFTDLRDGVRSLNDVVAFTGWGATLSGEGEAQRLTGAMPTWNALDVLGVQPLFGRGFLAEDGEIGADPVVLLGHGLWQRQFGGDRGVLGRVVEINRMPYTVIGVMPPGFRFPFLPQAEIFAPNPIGPGDRGAAYLRQFARLAPGASLAQAREELHALSAGLRERFPDSNRDMHIFVEPLQEAMSLAVRPRVLALQLAAWMVLLIAAANLASLMTARSRARAAEFAVRSSLGGSDARRFRLLLSEALLLALAGGLLAVLMSHLGVAAFAALFPDGFAEVWNVRLDWAVLSLTLAVSLLVAFALALTAHIGTRIAPADPSQGGGRSIGSRGGGRLAAALVVCNFALALAVSVGSLLLLASHARLQQVDLGYRSDGLLSGSTLLPNAAYADSDALLGAYQRIREALLATPGVEAIGLSSALPLGLGNNDTSVMIEGRVTRRPDGRAHVWINRASHDFLPTLGVRLREGRMLEETDVGESGRRLLVNAAFAEQYFGGESPIGRRLNFRGDEDPLWFEIVGVVDDIRHFDVSAAQTPTVYPALGAMASSGLYVTIRTSGHAAAMAPALRAAIHRVDPTLALSDLRSMADRVEAALALPGAVSRIAILFAACGLLLAGIGVYATLSQSVLRRTREFGVRRAMGARDASLMGEVLRTSIAPMLLGLAIGLPLAWWFGRRVEAVLYEVAPLDPGSWIAAIALLFAVGILASLLPGRKAMKVTPMTALRHE
jgi:putative ABC transport system permease protein